MIGGGEMLDYPSIIERIKQHDQEAFTILYHDTKNAVYSIIYAIVKQRQTTEDLMQDTYMKMLKNIHQYHGKVKFITWLITIAKHIAIDYYRKNKNLHVIDINLQAYLLPHHDDRVEKKLESEAFLSILTEDERQIVLLKIVADLKHHEIAKIVNKPLGTVMWIYNNALKKMRKFSEEG